ncbi:MAG: hypothetical protein ACAI44_10130 [Candidatus Sericytochromatia bacterium]
MANWDVMERTGTFLPADQMQGMHILAVPADQGLQALPEPLRGLRYRTSGPWGWIQFHPLQAEAQNLEQTLKQCQAAGLWFELETTLGWTLRLIGPGGQRVLMRESWRSGLEQGDPAAWPAGLAALVPPEKRAWQPPLRHRHELAGYLPDLLLDWEIGGVFGVVAPQPLCQPEPEQNGFFDFIYQQLADCRPQLLKKSIWLAGLADVYDCFLLAWFISDQVQPLLRVGGWQLPLPAWPAEAASRLQACTDGFELGFDFAGPPFLRMRFLREALELLQPLLKPGHRLELLTAELENPWQLQFGDPGARQRYGFQFQADGLHLQTVWPSIKPERLAQALALARWVRLGSGWQFPSAASKHRFLTRGQQRREIWLDGLSFAGLAPVQPDLCYRAFLANTLMLQDFRGLWDTRQAVELEAESLFYTEQLNELIGQSQAGPITAPFNETAPARTRPD